MQTYNPNNQSGNQTEQFQNQYQDSYQNNGTYQYNNTYYGTSDGSMSPNDFLNMDTGFEAGQQPVTMSGFQNLGAVFAQEVVAKSYLFMVIALIITAVAALTTSARVAYNIMFGSEYSFLIFVLAELGVVMAANWAIKKNNAVLAGVLFAVYSWMTGILFSIFFVIFTKSSIATVFMITAGMFAIMAIYGMVTKKDLTTAGNLLMMGLLGIILGGVVNVFMGNSMLDMIITVVGIIIFVGLTAYDSQKIKKMAAMANNSNVLSLAMMGALELYLDFINLFLKLLRLFGKSRD